MENTNTSYLTQTLLHLMTPCLSLLAYFVNSVRIKKKKGDITTVPPDCRACRFTNLTMKKNNASKTSRRDKHGENTVYPQ